MIRYHCPHCAALIAAHERRVGQSSVCKACLKPHQIPSDRSLWLDEQGDTAYAAAPTVPDLSLSPPTPEPVVLPATKPVIELDPPAATTSELLTPTVPEIQLPGPVAAVPLASPPLPPAPERNEGTPPRPTPAAVATPTPPLPTRSRVPPAPPRSQVETVEPPIEQRPAAPVQLQTQADIAVALTAALTSRMKPPPAPRRDLRLSTAAWMLLTGISCALILVTLFSSWDLLVPVSIIGAIQITAGYLWIVWLTHLRSPQRGLLCAIPPITLFYLAQYKYARLRPLRFVVTGVTLLVICLITLPVLPHTRALAKRNDPPAPPNPAAMSKLEQLRASLEQRSYDELIKLLELLAKTDPLLSEDAKDRAALSAELKALCQHQLTDVKVQAMAAYARWDPDNARAVCLAAVRSPTYEERRMALRLLPQWKDAESARAVQSLIGRPGTVETNQAKAALEEIGGAPAEQAAIALLNRAEDQATKLTALSVLEKVGGAETATSLRTYALASDDPVVQKRAEAAAAAIEARVRAAAP